MQARAMLDSGAGMAVSFYPETGDELYGGEGGFSEGVGWGEGDCDDRHVPICKDGFGRTC
jgi:hypothetical protein